MIFKGKRLTADNIDDLNISSSEKEEVKAYIDNTSNQFVYYEIKFSDFSKIVFEDERVTNYMKTFVNRNYYFNGRLATILLNRLKSVNGLADVSLYAGIKPKPKYDEDDVVVSVNEGLVDTQFDTLYIIADTSMAFWQKEYLSIYHQFLAYCASSELEVALPNYPTLSDEDPNPFESADHLKDKFIIGDGKFGYYSTARPVGPGTFPSNAKIVKVENFGSKKEIKEGLSAWGYVEFDCPLTEDDMYTYDLVPADK